MVSRGRRVARTLSEWTNWVPDAWGTLGFYRFGELEQWNPLVDGRRQVERKKVNLGTRPTSMIDFNACVNSGGAR